jgi:recombinational DNA repair protein RecR
MSPQGHCTTRNNIRPESHLRKLPHDYPTVKIATRIQYILAYRNEVQIQRIAFNKLVALQKLYCCQMNCNLTNINF